MEKTSCINPRIVGISRYAKTENGKKVLSWKNPATLPPEGYEIIKIPCGHCIECRLHYAKEWANRCMMESKCYESNYFITLTYNDEHAPRNEKGVMILKKSDLQNFWKRLRKNSGQKVRYFACGEYGSRTMRPHYHAIVFGLTLDDLRPWRIGKNGDMLYRSEYLEKIWSVEENIDGEKKTVPIGNVEIGSVTWQSCNYVARYVTKKVGNDDKYFETLEMVPEYITMSRKPGIGERYFKENYGDIYAFDEINLNTEDGRITFTPPRYFDKLLEKEGEADGVDYLSKIKEARQERYRDQDIFDTGNTDLNYYEYREVKKKAIEDRVKILKGREF